MTGLLTGGWWPCSLTAVSRHDYAARALLRTYFSSAHQLQQHITHRLVDYQHQRGRRGKTSLTACLLMTATMMVDGRKRTQPVTLIHATAVPTGWFRAKVSTVIIFPPKCHLKCEAMAVLVAQSPQAGPLTWVLNQLPSFALRSKAPKQVLLTQML